MSNNEELEKIKRLECTRCGGRIELINTIKDIIILEEQYKCKKCGIKIHLLK